MFGFLMMGPLAIELGYTHIACTCILQAGNRNLQFQNFTQFGVQISSFDQLFHNHKILPITMNNQWWNQSEFNVPSEKQEKTIGPSQKLEKHLAYPTKERKGKTLSISNFFQWKEAPKLIVGIAKFVTLFNVNINDIESLQKLSEKEKNYLENYGLENIFADTNRKSFAKFFQKSVNPPLNFSATLGNELGIVLIIQSQPQQQKCAIKVLNLEGYVHSILNNVDPVKELDKVKHHIKQKYKRVKNIICFDRRANKTNSKQFLVFFLSSFNEVIFGLGSSEQLPNEAGCGSKMVTLQKRSLQMLSTPNFVIFRTHQLSSNCQKTMRNLYKKYHKIDSIISQQVKNVTEHNVFLKMNEFFISLYGFYYNFINLSGLENQTDYRVIQNKILELFIHQKDQIGIEGEEVKEQLNRKLGHYPQKIQQGCKTCCVCEAGNKKKTRFKCQKCSQTYSRDICICIFHFKEFHRNITKYIPRGIKKGVRPNELLHLNQSADQFCTKKKQPSEFSHNTSQQNILDVFSKWQSKISKSLSSFNIMSSLIIENNDLNREYAPEVNQDPNLYYYLTQQQVNKVNDQRQMQQGFNYAKLEHFPQAKIEEQ